MTAEETSDNTRPIRMLAFGDSNTFGSVPVAQPPSHRYSGADRWPLAMLQGLATGGGPGPASRFEMVEEGLGGRTTDGDDLSDPCVTGVNRNGLSYLPAAIASHQPLDLVMIMLGTNDAKAMFARSPERIAEGMAKLVTVVTGFKSAFGYAAPRTLVIAPPAIAPQVHHGRFRDAFPDGPEKTLHLAPLYHRVAKLAGVHMVDAGQWIETDGIDGLHLTSQAHRRLGEELAAVVRGLFPSHAAEATNETLDRRNTWHA